MADEMVSIEWLSEHLRRAIDRFLGELTDLERPEITHEQSVHRDWVTRFTLENGLVPEVLAIACCVESLDANTANERMPALIRAMLSPLPTDTEFLSLMSKRVDRDLWERMKFNLGDESSDIAVGIFNDTLTDLSV